MQIESKRILKADHIRELGSQVVLDYADFQQRCDDHLLKVRNETQKMIKQATYEAESIRQQAETKGFEAGQQAGLQDADGKINQRVNELLDQKVAEKLETVLPALRQASSQLIVERDRWITEWEESAIRFCIAISEKVVQTQLELHPELAQNILTETLQLVAESNSIQLKMNPSDVDQLGVNAEKIIQDLGACGNVTIVKDEDISRGGCLILTEHGIIDSRIETRFERIAQELLQ
ncbi:hypothetical protein MNBD_PLANCTO02-2795 [hydrothermal vent metagenome]|uniref:Flagellar assembly protein FliH/Type III secretion system HrpE domain-containing protein n=1 Tax=hydrothermal vent metagenome TaxID=652676 RepID=A0A3B1DWS3_9ZZZZ